MWNQLNLLQRTKLAAAMLKGCGDAKTYPCVVAMVFWMVAKVLWAIATGPSAKGGPLSSGAPCSARL